MCFGEVVSKEVTSNFGVVALTFRSFDRHTVYKHQVNVGYLAHETCSFKKCLRQKEEIVN